MDKRHIVFERPRGSKSWTIAYRDPVGGMASAATPAVFAARQNAVAFVNTVMPKRRGWWAGKPDQVPMESYIATVEVPV